MRQDTGYWLVEVRGEWIDHCQPFLDTEVEKAFMYFLSHQADDRKVSLSYYGADYVEE